MVGNACGGGKSGSHGSKVILLSHTWWMEPSPQPLSPNMPALAANNREAGPSNADTNPIISRQDYHLT